MPQNLSPTISGVIRYPHCDRMAAWARLKIGSLSTSTPSQSKMTRSGPVFMMARLRLSQRPISLREPYRLPAVGRLLYRIDEMVQFDRRREIRQPRLAVADRPGKESIHLPDIHRLA